MTISDKLDVIGSLVSTPIWASLGGTVAAFYFVKALITPGDAKAAEEAKSRFNKEEDNSVKKALEGFNQLGETVRRVVCSPILFFDPKIGKNGDTVDVDNGLVSKRVWSYSKTALKTLEKRADRKFAKNKPFSGMLNRWVFLRLATAAVGIGMVAARTADAVLGVFGFAVTIALAIVKPLVALVSPETAQKIPLEEVAKFTWRSFSCTKVATDVAFAVMKIVWPSISVSNHTKELWEDS